jgi:hypothetical protein
LQLTFIKDAVEHKKRGHESLFSILFFLFYSFFFGVTGVAVPVAPGASGVFGFVAVPVLEGTPCSLMAILSPLPDPPLEFTAPGAALSVFTVVVAGAVLPSFLVLSCFTVAGALAGAVLVPVCANALEQKAIPATSKESLSTFFMI